jgi:hypothetical protein
LKSRAVLVIGMHRSGTSAVARGLQALSVYLGNDFLDAQPENPTGYWEDKGVVTINERALKQLGLAWDDVTPVAPTAFRRFRMRLLQNHAVRYVRRTFASQPRWGFKDPRTIRLLPFWRGVLRKCHADDAYVVVVRNPLSVAASLFRRQAMDVVTSHRLWLVHMIPFLRELRDRPTVVVDYDLLMADPRAQLARIATRLNVPSNETTAPEMDRFAADFLDERLRHSLFSPRDFDLTTPEARLTHEAYALLYELAMDGVNFGDDTFWSGWEKIERDLQTLIERH